MKVCKRKIIFVSIFVISIFLAGHGIAGDLNPAGPPGSTMKTLDHVTPSWSQDLNAAPTGRFVQVLSNQAILDKETGLVWRKSLSTTPASWTNAMYLCNTLNIATRKGWKLPSVQELASLLDTVNTNPALPSGHPFVSVQNNQYWTSTADVTDSGNAWVVSFGTGNVGIESKSSSLYVWCVRNGSGLDAQ
jgi:hypothetical protein